MSKLLDDALEGCSGKIFSTANPQSLAKRELPPGTWSQLYLVYTSHCLAQQQRPACRSVYYKVVKDWRRCLRFRRRSQHSTCGVCDKIKAAMRHSTCFWEHAKQCDAMLAHLSLQWACRRVYWGAREESRKKQGTLAIIVDGYDHSKDNVATLDFRTDSKGWGIRPCCAPALQRDVCALPWVWLFRFPFRRDFYGWSFFSMGVHPEGHGLLL